MQKNNTDIQPVDLTRNLIRFRTMHSRMDEIDACMAYIQTILADRGIEYKRTVSNGYPSLQVTPGSHGFPLLLMSHIDVVDAPDHLFEPRIEGGRLYGRGSYDDKYAVAVSVTLLIQWMNRLRAAGKTQKDLAFGILITSDEEIGGKDGARQVLKDIQPGFSIVLDGGCTNEVITKEKGIARVTLRAGGKTCHASRPWLGENAIDRLMADCRKFMTLFESGLPAEKDRTGHWHRTANLSVIHGGKSINQVPDHCEARLDIRYTEEENIKQLLDDIAGRLDSDLSIDMIEPVFISGDHPATGRILSLSPDITTGYEHGASDARHLMPYGLAGVVWGANGNLTQHSLNEHVEIDSIHTLHRYLDRLIQTA